MSKSAKYLNFYETIKEADMRLQGAVVLYDGEPHYVHAITDHMGEKFRVYIEPMKKQRDMSYNLASVPSTVPHINPGYVTPSNPEGYYRGPKMDEFMAAYPQFKVSRKEMSSPLFDQFKPFPLGFVNTGGGIIYAERAPSRHTQQGLTESMVCSTVLYPVGHAYTRGSLSDALATQKKYDPRNIEFTFFSEEVVQTIKGEYPDAQECLTQLRDPRILNHAIAFSRDFAFVKGPASMIFVVYKRDFVGYLPQGTLDSVRIDAKFKHIFEVLMLLGVFSSVEVCAE